MEDIVAEKSVCNKSETMLVSKSCALLAGSKSIELHGQEDEFMGNKCSHFSIRGYVAKIREVDRKICWPFVVHDNHNKELADSLPPLHVTQFRWWGCKTCLPKITTEEADTETRFDNCFKEKVKTNLPTKQGNLEATVLSPESILHLLDNEADIHDYSLSCSTDTDTKFTSKVSGNGKEENPSKITGRTTYGETKFESGHKGEEISREAKRIMIDLETTETSCSVSAGKMENASKPVINDENDLKVVTKELDRSKSNAISEQDYDMHRVAIGELNIKISRSICNSVADCRQMENMGYGESNLVDMMKEKDHLISYGGPQEVDLGIQNDEAEDVNLSPSSRRHPMDLDETVNEFSSENRRDLMGRKRCDPNRACKRAIDAENSDSLQGVGMLYSNDISHRKRPRKMRMLSDILNNEVVELSVKDQIREGGAESEYIDAAIDYPKSAPDISIRTDLDHCSKNHVVYRQDYRKANLRKNQTKMPQDENGESEDIDAAIDCPKSAPDASIRTDLDHCPQNNVADRQDYGKAKLRKQTKVPQVENGEISLMSWLQDSSRKPNCESYAGFQRHQKVPKNNCGHKTKKVCGNGQRKHGSGQRKQGNRQRKHGSEERSHDETNLDEIPMEKHGSGQRKHGNGQRKHGSEERKHLSEERRHEETTLDEIPMDIVELMAKYQHERLLWHSEKANESGYPLSETHGSKNGPKMTDFREVIQNEVPSLLSENNSSKKKPRSSNKGGVVFTAGGSTRNLEKNAIGHRFDSQGKYKSGILNANQFEQECSSTGFDGREKSSKAKFPITGSNKNSISQERKMVGSGWSPTCLQSLEANHMGQKISNPTSSGEPYYGESPILSNSSCFGHGKDQKVIAKSSHKCTLSNCPNPSQGPEGKLNTITCSNNSLNSIDPNVAPEIKNWKGKVASRTHRRAHRSFASDFHRKGKDHPIKNLGPSDLYKEDTISAMNLLRLMDQGAYSSTPINVLMGYNQVNLFIRPCFSNDYHQRLLFGLDSNLMKAPRPFVDPVSFGYLGKAHHLGSSCELVPVLPKIGNLRSSSQVQNCTSPCNWRSPTNFMGQYSTETSDMINKVISSPIYPVEDRDNFESFSVNYLKKSPQERTTNIEVEVNNKSNEEVRIMKGSCSTETCTLNRNPAEINMPEGESFDMIGLKDPNVRKLYPPSGGLNPERRKRKRIMKLTAIRGGLVQSDIP